MLFLHDFHYFIGKASVQFVNLVEGMFGIFWQAEDGIVYFWILLTKIVSILLLDT